ncbi:MAG TPA: hypothetical protein VGN80_16215 [Devosiaceae bacterium]|jgi:hypothetical protein|nr:hypothetical protein [Devosiaceae bacterium]
MAPPRPAAAGRGATCLLVALLASFLALPVIASDLPEAAEKPLWCASAFNWLARDADDAADAAGAEVFDAWSLVFTALATTVLGEAGYAPPAIEAAIAASDQAVLEEMQDRSMRYDVESCPELAPPEE